MIGRKFYSGGKFNSDTMIEATVNVKIWHQPATVILYFSDVFCHTTSCQCLQQIGERLWSPLCGEKAPIFTYANCNLSAKN